MEVGVVHVVDDDPLILRAMARLLRSHDLPFKTYGSAGDFLQQPLEPGPGCVLLDLSMPGMSGLELQENLASSGSTLAVIFLTGRGDIPASVRAMKAGALDFLTKPVEEASLLAAVRAAMDRSGELCTARAAVEKDWTAFSSLTPREKQVCLAVCQGLLNKQIAGLLGAAEKTIKLHRGRVMRKLRVSSVADLVRLVERLRDAGRLAPWAKSASR